MSFVLKAGLAGSEVHALQQLLIDKGAMPARDGAGQDNLDGRFGQITRDAVLKYQRDHGLAADGVVGEATARSLGLTPPQPAAQPRMGGQRAAAGHILTERQLHKLAAAVDALIPIPYVDAFDDAAIAWLVEKLDAALAELLPPKVAEYLQDLSQGLEGGDLGAFKKRLREALNQWINVPLLAEDTEARIIAFLVDAVVEGLRLGRTFEEALGRLLPRFA